MMETMCTYTGRDDLLIAYLYDEIAPAERTAFTAHLAACGRCSRELGELRGVRSTLSVWTPPEPARATSHEPPGSEPRAASHEPRATRQWWHEIPAWAQVAAALLVLGVSAGIANVDVRHDQSGWTLRTGWSTTPAAVSTGPAAAHAAPVPAGSSAPWRADLAALEQQLRTELHAVPPPSRVVSAASTISDAELRRRVRSILDESERRQESELALRVAEVLKDVSAQRQADLVKIDRSLGVIQSNTYGEAMKQRELINYLVKVQQKQ
jgi:anti-sigma factor RsiW